MTGPRTYRVVQWATGNIGSRSLRAVIEHPRLELAGVWVSSGDKAGRDAGDLCGLGPTGIVATSDIESILALGADCVLFMQQGCDVDAICALLEVGANVVATCGEFHHPAGMDPALRERVEAACAQGGASIHSTGVSPGFISEAVPIVLTSLQRRLDRLRIEEFADLSSRNSPELLFQLMGFANEPSSFDPGRWAHGAHAFGPSLRVVGDALGHAGRLGGVDRGGGHGHSGHHHCRRNRPRRDGRRATDDRVRPPWRRGLPVLQRHLVLHNGDRR